MGLEEELAEWQAQHDGGKFIDKNVARQLYLTNPLVRVLADETSSVIRRKMPPLKQALSKRLRLGQYSFLQRMLGEGWEHQLKLPSLEHVSNVQMYVDEIVAEVAERIDILKAEIRDINRVDANDKVAELIARPYFLTTEHETIRLYKQVLAKEANFHPQFFDYDYGRKAGIVTRHMFEQLKGYTPADVLSRGRRKDFVEYRLAHMLQACFQGSVQAAIHNAYRKTAYPHLYEKKDATPKVDEARPLGSLGHLTDSLDALFGGKQGITGEENDAKQKIAGNK